MHFQGDVNAVLPDQYYDAETGLMYNGARYFESAIGRFEQPDPSGFNGGISLYVYGLNNPLTYIDPLGLSPPGAPPPMGPFSPESPTIIPGEGAYNWANNEVGRSGYGYWDPNSEARGWLRSKTHGVPSENAINLYGMLWIKVDFLLAVCLMEESLRRMIGATRV